MASSKVFYSLLVVTAACYCAFLYDRPRFESFVDQYEYLKPVSTFFQAVEKYSPFHEFLLDEEAKSKTEPKPKEKPDTKVERILSKEELKEYDGLTKGKGPYLAVLGQVFDVSKKAEMYTPGSGYGFFSGIDGSRAFVTGEFNEEGLIDDVTDLSHQDYLGLLDWVQFYHKDYEYVGKVVGRFYDEQGKETEYKKEVDRWIGEAQKEKEKKDEEGQMYPSCNSEWGKEKGHR